MKDKLLVKKLLNKKIFEKILNSYNKSITDLNNVKDLHALAIQEKDEETVEDCVKKLIKF